MPRAIHIIGAGLAGLSAAVRLTERGEHVVVHEATPVAGGRCRSYHDLVLDMPIDNGNHLFCRATPRHSAICARSAPSIASAAPRRRSSILPIMRAVNVGHLHSTRAACPGGFSIRAGVRPAPPLSTICSWRACCGRRLTRRSARSSPAKALLYRRLVQPLLLAALNIDPPQGSAKLAAAVIAETLAKGGAACRPLIARDGLGAAMIEPALAFLQQRGTAIRFGHQLQKIRYGETTVAGLEFGDGMVPLAAE